MRSTIYKCIIPVVLLFLAPQLPAQEVENDFEYRTSVKMTFKPIKKLKLNFTPEVRLSDDFSIDRYMLETGAVFKAAKILYLGAGYRFVVNPRDEKDTEYLHRYEFTATVKKRIERFEPQFRLRYTNYADDDDDDNYLRYKAAVGYDIKNCKLTPVLSAELFHKLSDNSLHKMRYKLGLDYKLFKKNYLGVSYRLDYYLQKEKNNHIFSIGYKIKF